MLHQALYPDHVARTALIVAPGSFVLIVVAVVCGSAAIFFEMGTAMVALLSGAAGFAALALVASVIGTRTKFVEMSAAHSIAAFIENDASPSFITDAAGEVSAQNRAAVDRFGNRKGQPIARALREMFADPAAVLCRLQNRIEAAGAAREDLVTRRGHVRLSAHRIGETVFLWRLEDMTERAIGGRGAETISIPMLTASRTGTILFMNDALRRIIGERVKTLDRIFTDLPVRSGEEHEIRGAGVTLRALVAEVEGPGGRREMYFLPAIGAAPPQNADPAAFEALPVALVRMGADGIIANVNRAARGLLGDDAVGKPLGVLLEGLGRPVSDWLADAAAGRGAERTEILRLHRDDSDVFLQVRLSRVMDGGKSGLVAVISDATQFKTLEAQFVQSQKMQAIGQLAGGVAHDFNNLLTAISGHCDLLLLRHDRMDPEYADLVQINQNANRAASLVGQLLAFSRMQTLKLEPVDLRDTLADLTHLLGRFVGERVRLSFVHDPELNIIRADKRQLEQVIMNLVVNARDAMPDGGEVRIETETVVLREPLTRDRATVVPGRYVVVRVIDAGSGIAPDQLPKIFEPFYTTKRQGEGTGLGLSTAYGIVKQTGGFIFCDSVLGQGTTFTLYFPAHERVEEMAPEPKPVAAPQHRSQRRSEAVVLLVEDEAPVRAFASRALRLRGHTVIEAENAEEALHILEDQSLNIDVFVTDVIMPGLDGPTWVKEALKTRPDARVVFVSGYSEQSLTETRERLPNSVFLPKPFSLSELTATVQAQIH